MAKKEAAPSGRMAAGGSPMAASSGRMTAGGLPDDQGEESPRDAKVLGVTTLKPDLDRFDARK